ncbi:MAG TPA: hypothetical protein VF267_05515 [Gammaproteobacteria bacterium]
MATPYLTAAGAVRGDGASPAVRMLTEAGNPKNRGNPPSGPRSIKKIVVESRPQGLTASFLQTTLYLKVLFNLRMQQ